MHNWQHGASPEHIQPLYSSCSAVLECTVLDHQFWFVFAGQETLHLTSDAPMLLSLCVEGALDT